MWFFYAIFFAFWSAISTVLIKKLTSNLSSINILFFSGLFTIPFIILIILFKGGFPQMSINFFRFMFASSVIDFAAFLLAFEGIRRSHVSLVSPMASFSPVFTTFIAMFALHEIPPIYKLFAIFIIVIGAYLLQVNEIKKGVLEPIKKLISDSGVRLYFTAFFLWAITPIFQKKAIFETDPTLPLMASLIGMVFVFIYSSPLALRHAKLVVSGLRNNYKVFLLLGFFGALSQFAAYEAFSLTNVGYVSAVFRLSGIFGVLGGAFFLKEQKIREKLIGASIMLAGTFLLLI